MKQKTTQMSVGVLLGVIATFASAMTAYAYLAAPYSVTDQPTFITEKSMRINGRVNPSEMTDTEQWFEWGIVGRSDVYETKHLRITGGNKQVAASANLIGLAPSTQYFYRQIAENGRGKSIGQTVYGTTKPLLSQISPIALISSFEPTNVTETSATMRGYVSPHGNSSTRTWFEWGETSAIDKETTHKASSGSSGFVEVRLTNLMPGTLYYYRAVAENSQGRTYGLLKVVQTKGTPYETGVTPETPRAQTVQSPVQVSGGSTNKGTSIRTPGESAAASTRYGSIPFSPLERAGATSWRLPSWGVGSRSSSNGTGGSDTGNNETSDVETVVVGDSASNKKGTQQIAGVGGALTTVDASHMLTGKKSVEVAQLKVAPKEITPHTTVEYIIAYAYTKSAPAKNAELRITLPSDIIYIGDNTNGKLALDTSGQAKGRTYILPLGNITKGTEGRLSVLGMTTGEAKEFRDAQVTLLYTDETGVHTVNADSLGFANAGQENIASAAGANSSWSILPHTLLGWILYITLIIGAFIGYRKAKEYYVKKKEELAREDSEMTPPEEPPMFFPGEEMGTLVRA